MSRLYFQARLKICQDSGQETGASKKSDQKHASPQGSCRAERNPENTRSVAGLNQVWGQAFGGGSGPEG